MYKLNEKGSIDFSLAFISGILFLIGIILVYSATYVYVSKSMMNLYKNQILWVLIGIAIILILISIPNKFYYYFAYVFYALSLLLLLYAFFSGIVSKGAGRWIMVAGLKIQPSEFAKIGLLFALSHYLSKNEISLIRMGSLIIPGALIFVPFILVLKQPDLGTALIFILMSIPMFYWAGMSLLELFFLISPGISIALSFIPLILAFDSGSAFGVESTIPWGIFFFILCGVLYKTRPPLLITTILIISNLLTATFTNVLWNTFLKDYQKMRIVSFINPEKDAFGAGYQVIQSKVAIGSGHIFGKGYLHGTQIRLAYLPEQHTDFIYSVLGEQFGFFGCTVIILLFGFFIVRCIATTHYVRNRFTNLLIIGSTSIITFHIFINIAMVIGMMPVVGIPLPFLSYGGSFTFTIAILIGLILNARVSNQDF